MSLIIGTIIILIIITLLYIVSFYLMILNREIEKLSAYECGLEPIGNIKIKFEILYYVIGLLYLIFDLEIIFILPLVTIFFSLNSYIGLILGVTFLILLTIGFLFEWFNGILVLANK